MLIWLQTTSYSVNSISFQLLFIQDTADYDNTFVNVIVNITFYLIRKYVILSTLYFSVRNLQTIHVIAELVLNNHSFNKNRKFCITSGKGLSGQYTIMKFWDIKDKPAKK